MGDGSDEERGVAALVRERKEAREKEIGTVGEGRGSREKEEGCGLPSRHAEARDSRVARERLAHHAQRKKTDL
jgi:hypothetical protein